MSLKKFLFFIPLALIIFFFVPGTTNYDGKKTILSDQPLYLNTPLPYKKHLELPPELDSKALKIKELTTNYTFLERQPDERLQVASLTKIMTAVIVLESLDTDKVITVKAVDRNPQEKVIGLYPGQKIKASELLKALLIESYGDAARALAIEVAGSEKGFVELMNEKAKKLKLTNTSFSNPVGIDGDNNYSTAEEIITLTTHALSNKIFESIISIKETEIKDESGKAFKLINTNILLDNQIFFGVKTGYTPESGECLITYIKLRDRKILAVILNSSERFEATRKLTEWISKNYSW